MHVIMLPIALLLIVGFLIVLGWISGPAALGNILLGAGLALLATYAVEIGKRRQLGRDLAVAMYHELANRVARCCFDFEAPWRAYWEQPPRNEVNAFRAAKFSPQPPEIFNSSADKLALFGKGVPSALMAFYFRLSVLRRDIENILDWSRGRAFLAEDEVQIIASRVAATLAPGLEALIALAPSVRNAPVIDADAINTFDPGPEKRASGTLRERLSRAMQQANNIREAVEQRV